MFEGRIDNSREHFIRDRVAVVLLDGQNGKAWTQHPVLDESGEVVGLQDVIVDLREGVRPDVRPVLDLPDWLARAVYDTLRDLYEPEVADERRLRREDYLRAEGRVDRLLDVVVRCALDGVPEVGGV